MTKNELIAGIKDLFARYGSGDYQPTEQEKQTIDQGLEHLLTESAHADVLLAESFSLLWPAKQYIENYVSVDEAEIDGFDVDAWCTAVKELHAPSWPKIHYMGFVSNDDELDAVPVGVLMPTADTAKLLCEQDIQDNSDGQVIDEGWEKMEHSRIPGEFWQRRVFYVGNEQCIWYVRPIMLRPKVSTGK